MNEKMTVCFDDLLNKALDYWPDIISTCERTLFKTGGARYPELIKVHDDVEACIDILNDDLMRVMDWAIYKALHKCAEFQDYVRPKELNRDYLRSIFEHDLFHTDELTPLRGKYQTSA